MLDMISCDLPFMLCDRDKLWRWSKNKVKQREHYGWLPTYFAGGCKGYFLPIRGQERAQLQCTCAIMPFYVFRYYCMMRKVWKLQWLVFGTLCYFKLPIFGIWIRSMNARTPMKCNERQWRVVTRAITVQTSKKDGDLYHTYGKYLFCVTRKYCAFVKH